MSDCVWLEAPKTRKHHEIVAVKLNNGQQVENKQRGDHLSTAYCSWAGSSPALGQRNMVS